MRNEMVFKDSRLLESLDYIGSDLIAEAVDALKLPDGKNRTSVGKRKTLMYAAVLAACLVLMSAVIPVVGYLIERFPAGSSYAYELTYPIFVEDLEPLSDEEMVKINEVYEDWKYEQLVSRYLDFNSGVYSPSAEEYAKKQLGDDPHRFFNKERYRNYQYYGKFGDCVVLATENYYFTLTTFTVAGYEFELDGTADLLVYRNGEIMTLYEAHAGGYMTDAQVGTAHERYLAYQTYLAEKNDQGIAIPDYTPSECDTEPVLWEFVPSLEPLTAEQMKEIRKAYAEYIFKDQFVKFYRQYSLNSSDDKAADMARENAAKIADLAQDDLFGSDHYASRYYGSFDGYAIVAVVSDMQSVTEYILADTSIVFPHDTQMYAYRDGVITEFGAFYQSGLMSDDAALLLATRHQIYEAMAKLDLDYHDGSYLKPIKGVEPLTSEQINKIRSAYGNYVGDLVLKEWKDEGPSMANKKASEAAAVARKRLFGDDINAVRYYGIIENYAVFGVAGAMSLAEGMLSSFIPYVYSFDHDMVFKYTANMLSEEGQMKLAQRQSEYQHYLDQNGTTEVLIENYFGKSNFYDDLHPIDFLYQVGDCLVAIVKSGYEPLFDYNIGGYTFTFPYGVDIYVGRHGETHSLYVAHQIGYVSDDNMAELYVAYLEHYDIKNP